MSRQWAVSRFSLSLGLDLDGPAMRCNDKQWPATCDNKTRKPVVLHVQHIMGVIILYLSLFLDVRFINILKEGKHRHVMITATECLNPEHPLDFKHFLFLFCLCLFIPCYSATSETQRRLPSPRPFEIIFYSRNKLVLKNICYFYHLPHKQCF